MRESTISPSFQRLVILLLMLMIAINIFSLGDYPIPYMDEFGDISTGYNYVTTGLFHNDIFDAPGAVSPRMGRPYHALLGLVVMLFPSLVAARLVIWTGWLISGVLLWLIVQETADKRAAWLSVLVFGSALPSFFSSHVARSEMWVVVFYLIFLWASLMVKRREPTAGYLLLGILAVVGALGSHLNGLFFSFPIVLTILWDLLRAKNWRALGLFLGAAGITSVGFFFLHLWPDPLGRLQYSAIDTNIHCDTPFCIGSTSGGTAIYYLKYVYLNAFNRAVVPMTVYSIASVLYLFRTQCKKYGRVLFQFGLSFLLFMVFPYKNATFYGSLWVPYQAILIALAVVTFLDSEPGERVLPQLSREWLSLAAAAPLLLAGMLAQAWLGYKFAPRDLRAYHTAVAQTVPPEVEVLAPPTFWMLFHERNGYLSEIALSPPLDPASGHRLKNVADLNAVLDARDLSIVVYDGSFLGSQISTDLSIGYGDYLATRCKEIGRVEDRWFGAYGQNGQGMPTIAYDCSQHLAAISSP